MQGFSDIYSQVGDSATPLHPPLEPRLKDGQDAATAPSPPESFDTPVGKRRVPRDKDPERPRPEMIQEAREGNLTGFPRTANIVRASDFIGMVNPKTAVITLNELYYFETRFLYAKPTARPPMSSAISPREKADEEKTLRTLYYISLNRDELPSFHFWTKPGDLDPITAGESYDWGEHFDKNPPSPNTAAKIAMLENKRTGKVLHEADEQQNTQKKQSLDFLDPYNDSKGSTEGRPPDDNGPISEMSASAAPAQPPIETEVLLQFNRGGMYLREFTHKALYRMACWLVKNEQEEDVNEGDPSENALMEPRDIFLDIMEHGKSPREEKIVSVSNASNRSFREKIQPLLGQPDVKFRIRSTKYSASWNLASGFDSGGVGDLKYDLKLVRPNVGYCYCSADWHLDKELVLNSHRFEKAIRVLFDWKLSPHPSSKLLNLEIPEHGSFNLDRDLSVVVDAKVQKIFAELSETLTKADSRPAEIFIRDVVSQNDIDGPDLLGTRQYNGDDSTEAKDLTSIEPHLLSISHVKKLQEQLRIAKASIEDSDDLRDQLEIEKAKLSEMRGLKARLKTAEHRASLSFYCPFCERDFAGMSKEDQQYHFRSHRDRIAHKPAEQQCPQPNCTIWMGEGQSIDTYEAILEHLRTHIDEEHAEDGICDRQGCHTNMYALTAEQHAEHDSTHAVNEEMVNRLQQEVKSLRDAANEREQLRNDLIHMTEERNSLQKRAAETERSSKAAPDLDEGMQTKEPTPGTAVAEDHRHPNPPEASRLQYCNVCLKSVDKISAVAKLKHAEKCGTSVSEFLFFKPSEAKAERERRNENRNVVAPQGHERTDEGVGAPSTGKTRKQKASAKAAQLESNQDEAEDAHTSPKPETRESTGRKPLKRKNDTFKPSKEDESEDEEPELPRKKAKLKAKAANKDKEVAPRTRSTRNRDIYRPPTEEEDDEEEEEEAHDEPSLSARGGKRKKRATAATTVSKKAKTKK